MSNKHTAVMTTKDWMIMHLITFIPIVGIIMMFVWAFGKDANINKRNYARASLIWSAIILVLYVILLIIMLSAGTADMDSLNSL